MEATGIQCDEGDQGVGEGVHAIPWHSWRSSPWPWPRSCCGSKSCLSHRLHKYSFIKFLCSRLSFRSGFTTVFELVSTMCSNLSVMGSNMEACSCSSNPSSSFSCFWARTSSPLPWPGTWPCPWAWAIWRCRLVQRTWAKPRICRACRASFATAALLLVTAHNKCCNSCENESRPYSFITLIINKNNKTQKENSTVIIIIIIYFSEWLNRIIESDGWSIIIIIYPNGWID